VLCRSFFFSLSLFIFPAFLLKILVHFLEVEEEKNLIANAILFAYSSAQEYVAGVRDTLRSLLDLELEKKGKSTNLGWE
jgi:hypothetical protein